MELDYKALRDKILGCWQGKNAGGVLGAPVEGHRGPFDLKWYMQKDLDKNPPPNDDLDLQIVWLAACERFGATLTAARLAEYWQTFLDPWWSEYGIGKSNLRRGIAPPMSGRLNNYYKDSCGCFIRSEIWACLFPGNPSGAVRYAYLDACVDHADEGLYGELFFAALESAAFVESDLDRLVEIGLSYIPEDCDVARAVRLARECYKSGLPWLDARNRMCREVPGAFSAIFCTERELEAAAAAENGMPRTRMGNDAPNNIGFTMIGLYYGEGDFGKTLLSAVNCGEDTDCTGGTAGAVFGLIHGLKGMDEKWLAPIGGVINTLCINRCSQHVWIEIPPTVEELTDRVLACIPKMNEWDRQRFDKDGRFAIRTEEPEKLAFDRGGYPLGGWGPLANEWLPRDLAEMNGYVQFFNFDAFKLKVSFEREPYLSAGETFRLKVEAFPTGVVAQCWIDGKVYCSHAGVKVTSGAGFSIPMFERVSPIYSAEIALLAETLDVPDVDILIDCSITGRAGYGVAKVKLFAR